MYDLQVGDWALLINPESYLIKQGHCFYGQWLQITRIDGKGDYEVLLNKPCKHGNLNWHCPPADVIPIPTKARMGDCDPEKVAHYVTILLSTFGYSTNEILKIGHEVGWIAKTVEGILK